MQKRLIVDDNSDDDDDDNELRCYSIRISFRFRFRFRFLQQQQLLDFKQQSNIEKTTQKQKRFYSRQQQ